MLRKSFYMVLGLFLFSSLFSIALEQTAFALAAVLYLAIAIRGGDERIRRTVLDLPLAAFVLATLISVLLSGDPAGSIRATRNYLLMPVIYIVGFSTRDRDKARKFAIVLLAAAAASALAGIMIYITSTGGGGLKRASGTFSMPLTYGGIMMLACSLFLALALSFGRDSRRAVFLCGGGTVLTGAALFLSFTRSSWLGMLVSGIMVILILRKKLLIPFALILVISAFLLPGEYRERITSIWDPDYPSNRQRIELIKGGTSIFMENPLFGVGPGDLAYDYERHMPEGAEVIHGHMHNTFLHIAVTRGLPGLLTFLWFVVSVYRLLSGALSLGLPPPEKGWAAGAIAAFTGFLVNGFFEWNFGDAEVITLLYIIIGSSLLLFQAEYSRDKGRVTGRSGDNLS